MNVRRRGGFTMMELMIVVAIISILAMTAVPNFSRYRQTAHDSAVALMLAEIGSLQREYYSRTGRYLACPLNPARSGGDWQDTGAWRDLDFRPMQPTYGYQFKIDVGPDGFTAQAIKNGRPVFTAGQSAYDVRRVLSDS